MWQHLITQFGSQRKLADALGLAVSTVNHHVLKGNPIPPEWARKLHDERGIPLHELRPDLWPAA